MKISQLSEEGQNREITQGHREGSSQDSSAVPLWTAVPPNTLLSPALLILQSLHFGESAWVKAIIFENQESEFIYRDECTSHRVSQNFPWRKNKRRMHTSLFLVVASVNVLAFVSSS